VLLVAAKIIPKPLFLEDGGDLFKGQLSKLTLKMLRKVERRETLMVADI
jgi:hypothetical protein